MADEYKVSAGLIQQRIYQRDIDIHKLKETIYDMF